MVELRVLGAVAPDTVRLEATQLTVLMPTESTIAVIGVDERLYTIDRSCFVIAPPGASILVRASASVASVAALTFSPAARARMLTTHGAIGVDAQRLEAWVAECSVLPRTVWVHELAHRYRFERDALEAHGSEAARFLETELLKEIYFLFRDRDEGSDRASILRAHSKPVAAVIEYVHTHVTHALPVKTLAKLAGTSERSLLRAFRKELGSTPAAYWRDRKLDAALDLLRGGAYTVAEVAERIGYDNTSAFSDAFRRRFGRPPSSFKPARPVRPPP
ncbi:MAG: helix-turn-helix domain-containing protein [Nannocystales bacterium]